MTRPCSYSRKSADFEDEGVDKLEIRCVRASGVKIPRQCWTLVLCLETGCHP